MTTTDFRRRVLAAVARIPAGRVATYGDIAAKAGNPRASRAVGNIMRECRSPAVPCHRVIAAGGRLGGFGSSPQLKKALLRAEGVLVVGSRVKDFERHRATEAHGNTRKFRGRQKSRGRATRGPDGDV